MAAKKVTLRIFDLEMDRVLPVHAETEWSIKQVTRGIKKHREDLHGGAWKLQRDEEDLLLQRSLAEYLDQWGITEDTDVRLVLVRIPVDEAVRIGMMRLAPGVALEAAQAAVDAQIAALKAKRAAKHAASKMEAEQPIVPTEDAEVESNETPAEYDLTSPAKEEPTKTESLEQLAEPITQKSPAQPPVVENDGLELMELEPADEPAMHLEESGDNLKLLAEATIPTTDEDATDVEMPLANAATVTEESETPPNEKPVAFEVEPPVAEPNPAIDEDEDEDEEPGSVAALLAQMEQETEGEEDVAEPLAPVVARTPTTKESQVEKPATPAMTTETPAPAEPAAAEQQPEAEKSVEPETEESDESNDDDAMPVEVEKEQKSESDIIEQLTPTAKTQAAVEKPAIEKTTPVITETETPMPPASEPAVEKMEPTPPVAEKPEENDDHMSFMMQFEEKEQAAPAPEMTEEPVAEVAPEEPDQETSPTETLDATTTEPDEAELPDVEEIPTPLVVHVASAAEKFADSPSAPVELELGMETDEEIDFTIAEVETPAAEEAIHMTPDLTIQPPKSSVKPVHVTPIGVPQPTAMPIVPASFIDTTNVDISLGEATPSTEIQEAEVETTEVLPSIGAGELEIALGNSNDMPESEITTPQADESTNDIDVFFENTAVGTTINDAVAEETAGETPVAADFSEYETAAPTGDNIVTAQASVSYMARMCKTKWHAMQITVSGETGHPSQAPESQLTIRPVFAGCSVNPSSRLVPLNGEKQETQFSVLAESTGKLPEARIELHLPDRKVGIIKTPAASVSAAIPRIIKILGLLAFAGLSAWAASQANWAQWPEGNIWKGLRDVLLTIGWIPWAILGGLIILSVVLIAVAFRPRRAQTATRSVPLERTD